MHHPLSARTAMALRVAARPPRTAAAMVALVLLCASACSSEPAAEPDPPIRHNDRMAVWVEFVDLADTDKRMAFAAKNKLNVHHAFMMDQHDRDDLRTICKAAATHDVALVLWPLVAKKHGYWAGQSNAELFSAEVDKLRGFAGDDCPRLDAIVIDMEMPYDRAMQLETLLGADGSTGKLVAFLQAGIDAAVFDSARVRYQKLVADTKADGLRIFVSSLAMLADDLADGDETIAKALWTPVQGIAWDRVSLQVYRSLFDQQFKAGLGEGAADFTAGLVTSYAETIAAEWGDRAAVDLGSTGGGISLGAGVASAKELQADIAAALAAGIPAGRVHIYSLEGLDGRDDAADWVAVPLPEKASVDGSTKQIRALFSALDAMGG